MSTSIQRFIQVFSQVEILHKDKKFSGLRSGAFRSITLVHTEALNMNLFVKEEIFMQFICYSSELDKIECPSFISR